jgi:hypothetical protein
MYRSRKGHFIPKVTYGCKRERSFAVVYLFFCEKSPKGDSASKTWGKWPNFLKRNCEN